MNKRIEAVVSFNDQRGMYFGRVEGKVVSIASKVKKVVKTCLIHNAQVIKSDAKSRAEVKKVRRQLRKA